jgi:hypothetical protein
MIDLTVLFLTVNRVPEIWAAFHRIILLEAIKDFPLITISRKPMDLGLNLLQTEPASSANIYVQMLKGAKQATTPYVAVAEDDVLYCREHFISFRPPPDTFAYNMTRWSLYTFGECMYSYKHRIGNFALIAPRQLMIEALEERFAKYPGGTPEDKTGELGKPRTEKRLGVTLRNSVEFWTTTPIVQFSHDFGIEEIQRKHTKRMGWIRAYDIPYWRKAEDLRKRFV